jgi:glycosyltransferase involved in cell wall biosynthesis
LKGVVDVKIGASPLTISMLTQRPETLPGSTARAGWLHVCNGLDPVRDGGMVPSILGMTGALAGQGGAVSIVTPTPSRLDDQDLPDGLELHGPEANLEGSVARAEVVHLHGLWQGHTRRGALAARRADVPYIVAAHGMAEPWALRHKALKKKVYTALVEGKNLRRASCLHALSRPEIGHLRAFAPRAPICLVPNGVDLRPFDDLPPRSELEAEHPELAGKFILLFYGRLHVKKGLDLLAKALGAIGSDRADLHVVLAGNDDGALKPFRNEVESLHMSDRVTCVGHASSERARRIWGAADAFILPSYSEGFSMAILEALAARKPVVATTSCHFPELARAEGGIVVEPTEAGVTAGLRDLLERSDVERRDLAGRGRTLVESQYTWDRQAERLAGVYRWVAGGGVAPEAVEMAGGF